MHAWLEFQLPNGFYFPMNPSIEWRRVRVLTKRNGGLANIPDDRLIVSYGANFKIETNQVKYKIDILKKPIYC